MKSGFHLYENRMNENWIEEKKKLTLRLGCGKTPYPGRVLKVQCTRFKCTTIKQGCAFNAQVQSNYSSCTDRSSENICSSIGGAQEALGKRKRKDETQFCEFHPPTPLMLMYFFWVSFLKISPHYDQTQGSGAGFFNFQEKY